MGIIHRAYMASNAVRGAALLGMYEALKHKKDKTEFEWNAYKQFRKFLHTISLIILLFFIAITIILVDFLVSPYDAYIGHPGKYKDGMIVYIDNTEQHASLKSLGLSVEQLEEGDSVTVYTTHEGIPKGAEIDKESLAKDMHNLVMLGAVSILFVVVCLIYGNMSRKRLKYFGAYLRGETEV